MRFCQGLCLSEHHVYYDTVYIMQHNIRYDPSYDSNLERGQKRRLGNWCQLDNQIAITIQVNKEISSVIMYYTKCSSVKICGLRFHETL